MNCLSVFDHFVGLTLKKLRWPIFYGKFLISHEKVWQLPKGGNILS